MSLILWACLAVFTALCLGCLAWYAPRLAAWFGAVKPQKRLKSEKKRKLAVVVPARNESKAIGDLLSAVRRQTYGKENFDLFVVVQSPLDPTVAMAEAVGGRCFAAENQTCKGDALDFCLKSLLAENPDAYDAYLIIDADCTPSDDYLEEMNNALSSGRQVIQSKRIVKNYLIGKNALSLSACCNGLIWTIIDSLGNRYKSDRGVTCMTIGTGIMLRADVVKQLGGWPYRATLTEDMELMNDCAVKNISTFYYEYAKLYLEESTSLRVTNKRRTRWLTGVIDSKRLYADKLKKSAKTRKEKRDKYFVTALRPVFAYVGVCVLFFLGFLVTATVLFFLKNPLFFRALVFAAVPLGVVYLSFFVLTLFCMIADRKYILLPWHKKLLLLFAHPVFYMGYIPIIARALFFKGNREWAVIDRIDCSLSGNR